MVTFHNIINFKRIKIRFHPKCFFFSLNTVFHLETCQNIEVKWVVNAIVCIRQIIHDGMKCCYVLHLCTLKVGHV